MLWGKTPQGAVLPSFLSTALTLELSANTLTKLLLNTLFSNLVTFVILFVCDLQ